ncbi:hypothetical protein DEU56DRAFT_753975 [Suillus clintonianus]|uniref:uncharacterized protein n=1 Tax=Suillus clintonianus TaxID=1904413 RepID=UPI001B86B8F8|nr:uncharacterized protein DEU56DRAFT_753975 [Suillus clintonianus]KAG2145922.1 hypothetical protein DEU56DRAFT_753975 [Suillus clintonianus]
MHLNVNTAYKKQAAMETLQSHSKIIAIYDKYLMLDTWLPYQVPTLQPLVDDEKRKPQEFFTNHSNWEATEVTLGLKLNLVIVLFHLDRLTYIHILYCTGHQPSASPLPNHIIENDILMYDAECQAQVFSPPIEPQAPSSATQMRDASTSPIISSKSVDFSHQTPSLARPFPLPSAIKDHLNRLVAQHFLELSDHVLVPALENAVDSLIPSVVEQISDNIKNATIGPQSHGRKGKDILSDTQLSDSEDDLKPSPCRKRPGKRGLRNCLHVAFWTYLEENRHLKGKNCSLPQSPSLETLHVFNNNNDCIPTQGDISIDWNNSLKKSPWNTEVINLLVITFQAKVSNGTFAKVIFDAETISLDNLCTLCIEKLRQIQVQHRQHIQIGKFANVEDMNQASRKLSLKQPTGQLDVEQMSGDETDTPLGVTPKVVRRVGLPWLSLDINAFESAGGTLIKVGPLELCAQDPGFVCNPQTATHFSTYMKN